MHTVDSLCCAAETNMVLQNNYTSVKKKKEQVYNFTRSIILFKKVTKTADHICKFSNT